MKTGESFPVGERRETSYELPGAGGEVLYRIAVKSR